MRILSVFVLMVLIHLPASAADDLINKASQFGAAETMNRLESALKDKGLTIFARIDHSKGAESVGQELRPTELIIFGSPKAGTPLMVSNQLAGIDLPLKALVWQDGAGKVWLTYGDPARIAARHHIADRDPVIAKMQGLLGAVTDKAVK